MLSGFPLSQCSGLREVTKIKQGISEKNLVRSVISELSSSEFMLNLESFLERSIILLNFKFSLVS